MIKKMPLSSQRNQLPALIILFAFFLLFYFVSEWFKKGAIDQLENFGNTQVQDQINKISYPSDWAWLQRTFPYGRADKTAHVEALKAAQKMRQQAPLHNLKLKNQLNINNEVSWQFAGPINVGGRVVDIEFNPVDPNVVYAGAATGGVFKSEDMGFTWQPIFDEQTVLTIGDLAVDPVKPNILYVGTGEANGGHNNFPGGGVYKSTDAGATWQFIGLENTASIGRIIVDPANPQRVFVAAVGSYFLPNPERGIYRSDDAGLSWSNVLFISDSTGAIDLVINPDNPSVLLAAFWERVRRPNDAHLYGKTSGIYKTIDGGDSWYPVTQGLPDANLERVGRIGLTLCASEPDILYALYNDGSEYTGIFRSPDAGESWLQVDLERDIARGTSNFSWYFGQVRVHPTNPERVFALDVHLMSSRNGGDNWSFLRSGNMHVDHHALAFHPSHPDTLIDGNDGGINISFNGGLTWRKVAELPVTQFYEITIDATRPERLYGGTQDNGTIRTLGGTLSDWQRILGGDGFYVIVDPIDPAVIYAESQFGDLFKSVNGGNTFFFARSGINSLEDTNWSTPVVMDPNNNLVLYYGTDKIYRTEDGAISWTPISANLTDGGPDKRLGTVTTIAVAPTNSNVIYAGTDDSHVWVSEDYGQIWKDVSATLPYRWVTRVVVDPADENIAYVTFSGLKWRDPQPHVFRTENKGTTWEDISSNLPDAPVNALAVDPKNRDRLYVGTDVGAYVSFDTGQSWQPLGTGLPLVPVNDLKIHQGEYFLIAGTHGRSMFKLDLNSLVTGVGSPAPKNVITDLRLEQNFPNPFNPQTHLRFTISQSIQKSVQVELEIYDITGRTVRTLFTGLKSAGTHTFQWDGKEERGLNAASGIYLYRLRVGETVLTKKMILAR